jgi:hypothetical protein
MILDQFHNFLANAEVFSNITVKHTVLPFDALAQMKG